MKSNMSGFKSCKFQAEGGKGEDNKKNVRSVHDIDSKTNIDLDLKHTRLRLTSAYSENAFSNCPSITYNSASA